MDNITLRSLRRHLFFTQPEAARMIGRVSHRSWVYYESGEHSIPATVVDEVRKICEWRIEQERAILDNWPPAPEPSIAEWVASGQDVIFWRPHCSALASAHARRIIGA